ncbi:MAG TPA: hypothetical protein VL651_12110 [Bacteroidia bacterium]|jgi:hypothetical protein|nr:hypothetical protein [Bacteroidia bacterium]
MKQFSPASHFILIAIISILSSCGQSTKETKPDSLPGGVSSVKKIDFRMPPDSFVILDSLSHPRARLILWDFENELGPSPYLVTLNDTGQIVSQMYYENFGTIDSASLEAVKLDEKGSQGIIIRFNTAVETPKDYKYGWFRMNEHVVNVFDSLGQKKIFFAFPDYHYQAFDGNKRKEDVNYSISISSEGIRITDKKGQRSKYSLDTINGDCYRFDNGNYVRCK